MKEKKERETTYFILIKIQLIHNYLIILLNLNIVFFFFFFFFLVVVCMYVYNQCKLLKKMD